MREECGCCTMELEDDDDQELLWTPCCGGWFHRTCIEKTAESAGTHFFKCPLCNNKDEFTEEMLKFGVYIPDRDADWETAGTFDDQLERHDTCDAEECGCPGGRRHDEEDTGWEIMLCVCCGAQGIHVQCGQLNKSRPRWKCPLCRPVVNNMSRDPISVFTRVKRSRDPANKEFSRSVLENLTFRVSTDYEISVDMHKNRKDPKDPVVVSFKVTGVPAFDIPKPVKLRKDDHEDESDEIKQHRDREEKQETSDKKEKQQEDVQSDHNSESSDSEQVEDARNESIEILKEVTESPSTKAKTVEKQSSILSFFKRFSPSEEENSPVRKKIKLSDPASPVLKTPLKEKNRNSSGDKVISSPVGYFKIDEDCGIR